MNECTCSVHARVSMQPLPNELTPWKGSRPSLLLYQATNNRLDRLNYFDGCKVGGLLKIDYLDC
uniref:Uncharacterized protein n=1 Tax=Picea glauca TaxID=3330 RepID=A0A101M4J9_PICGL|nr:hypothetical protein ABT39_MTgene694 [Picea glauca]